MLMFDFFALNGKFVVGYNKLNGTIYRLKGFRHNEFYAMFSEYFWPVNLEENYQVEKILASKKAFLKTFEIQSLDMGCLYKTLKRDKIPPVCLRRARKVLDQFYPW